MSAVAMSEEGYDSMAVAFLGFMLFGWIVVGRRVERRNRKIAELERALADAQAKALRRE